jgi:hypothetical protein
LLSIILHNAFPSAIFFFFLSRETGNIGHKRRRKTKQKHNTIRAGHHQTQANTKQITQTITTTYLGLIFFPNWTVYMSNSTGVLLKAGTACPSQAHEFTPGFLWGPCCLCLVFRFV